MNIHECGAREKEQFATVIRAVFFLFHAFTSKSVPTLTRFFHLYLPLFISLSQTPNSLLFRFPFHRMSQSVVHFRVLLSLYVFPNFHLHLCFASSYNLCFFSDRFSWSVCFRRSVFFYHFILSFLLISYFYCLSIFIIKLYFEINYVSSKLNI